MNVNDPKIEVVVEPDLQGRIVMVVRGVLDLTEVPDFREVFSKVLATDCPDVVVDLTDVSFVGSSGLGLLLQAHSDLAADGRTLVVKGTQGSIRRAFEITHLDYLLEPEGDAPAVPNGSGAA